MGNEMSAISCGAVTPRETSKNPPLDDFAVEERAPPPPMAARMEMFIAQKNDGRRDSQETDASGDRRSSSIASTDAGMDIVAESKNEEPSPPSFISILMKGTCSGPGACGGDSQETGDMDAPLKRTRFLYPDHGKPTIRVLKTPKDLTIRTYSWRLANPRGQVLLLHAYGGHSLFDWLHHDLSDTGKRPTYRNSWIEAMNLAGFSVYAMDMQGHGFSSSWNGKRCNVESFADYCEDVIQMVQEHMNAENNKNRPIYLVGVSMGGCIAVRTAEMLSKRNLLCRPNFMGKDDREIADVQRLYGTMTPAMAQAKKDELFGTRAGQWKGSLLQEMQAAFEQGIQEDEELSAPASPIAAQVTAEKDQQSETSEVQKEDSSQDKVASKMVATDEMSIHATNGTEALVFDDAGFGRPEFDNRSVSSSGMGGENLSVIPTGEKTESSASGGICSCESAATVVADEGKESGPVLAVEEPRHQIPLGGLILLAPLLGLNQQATDQAGSSSMLPLVSSMFPNCSVAERPKNSLYPEVESITAQDALTFKGYQRARLAKEMLTAIDQAQEEAVWLGMPAATDKSVSTTSTADDEVNESQASRDGMPSSQEVREEREGPNRNSYQLSVLVVRSRLDKIVDVDGIERFYQTICGGDPEFVPHSEKIPMPPLLKVSGSGTLSLPPKHTPGTTWTDGDAVASMPIMFSVPEEEEGGGSHGRNVVAPSLSTMSKPPFANEDSSTSTGSTGVPLSTSGSGGVTNTTTASSMTGSVQATPRVLDFNGLSKSGGSGKLAKLEKMQNNFVDSQVAVGDAQSLDDDTDAGLVAEVGDDTLITTHPDPSISGEPLVDDPATPAATPCFPLCASSPKADITAMIPPLQNRQMWVLEDMNHWLNKEIGNERLANDIVTKWLLPRALAVEQ